MAADPAKPGRVGCGGEEEEGPRGDDDQHGGDVVQEDVPLPPRGQPDTNHHF